MVKLCLLKHDSIMLLFIYKELMLKSIGRLAFNECDNLVIYSTDKAYAHACAMKNKITWSPSIELSETGISLEYNNCTYDGTYKMPSVIVKEGKNF